MNGTIKLEDMRLFAKVAEQKSFTAAAKVLEVPKQTLSRRVAELERALGVQLLRRTTRRLHLTSVGAAYFERCADIVRAAEEANRAVADTDEQPRGTLRITADPTFGEAFLTDLVVEYARRWPEVRLDVVLTRRRTDLIEEGFDVAFRVGKLDDPALTGFSLGPARVRYCASPEYIVRRGTPRVPHELARHDCIVVGGAGSPARWPFPGKSKGDVKLVPVDGKLTFSSFAMAKAAALEGLGVTIFPEFACAREIQAKRLVAVLDAQRVEVGSVWLVHAAGRFLPARARAFVALARERFATDQPWL
jgi:DNA-binding transcriptional LysR family regulator